MTASRTSVAAIDCGTTTIKAGVFDLKGKARSFASKDCPCIRHADGRIENSPRSIAQAACWCLNRAVRSSGVHPRDISSLSVSSQRATVMPVDRRGVPLANAISWQDMRGAAQIDRLRTRIDDKTYYRITGLPNHPVFSLAKILWMKANARAAYRKAAYFLLVHDYVLRQLGCEAFCSDWSNASLTGLLDVSRLQWSPEVAAAAGIDLTRLPELVPSARVIGRLSSAGAARTGLLEGTPLVSGGGDQQCAGVGAGAVEPGILEITLGTAAVPLCYTDRPRMDPAMRVTCCAHAVPGRWNLEGLQNTAGASLQWIGRIVHEQGQLPDRFFRRVAQVRPGAGGVLFYPYLDGASAPHWDPRAKAMFLGLTLAHDRFALMRAVMEGVALETREIVDVFSALKVPVRQIRFTGGCTKIRLWNQIYADVLGKPICTLENPEASLLGAAILAARGVGVFASIQQAAQSMVRIRERHIPAPENVAEYDRLYERFCENAALKIT